MSQPQKPTKLFVNPWNRLSITFKLGFTIGLMLLTIAFFFVNMLNQSNFTMQAVNTQTDEYHTINALQKNLTDCETLFENFLRSISTRGELLPLWEEQKTLITENLSNLNVYTCEDELEEYFLSEALQSGFLPFIEQGNLIVTLGTSNLQNDNELFEQYANLETTIMHLLATVRDLQTLALSAGQSELTDLQVQNQSQNDFYILLSVLTIFVFIALASELIHTIVTPLSKLSQASKDITTGNFDTPDISVQSKDEIYNLALAFNEMKHNMKNLFETMSANTKMAQQLHEQEIEMHEQNKLLEQAKMQQLRNQINPHFLFNTLNIISRTARREKAKQSEKLILSLARLFRYGLKTDDVEVPLEREINIVNDYISIQQTRFENRVKLRWNISENIETEKLLVPAFLFQPLIENAVIHGLEPKKDGGTIRVKIRLCDDILQIKITDNGVGMNCNELENLLNRKTVKGDVSGIGMGNVRDRVMLLHQFAEFKVHSKKNFGTSIMINFCTKDTPVRTTDEKD